MPYHRRTCVRRASLACINDGATHAKTVTVRIGPAIQ
jgi:hypothetical protein